MAQRSNEALPTRAPGDCPCSRDRSVAAGAPLRALGIARNGQRRWIHTRSRPFRRTVRGSMSKHDRFFDKLERRAPRKRCRRCRQKFTPPAGHSNLICPACRENRENRLMRPGPPRNPMRDTAAPRKTSCPNVFSPTDYSGVVATDLRPSSDCRVSVRHSRQTRDFCGSTTAVSHLVFSISAALAEFEDARLFLYARC